MGDRQQLSIASGVVERITKDVMLYTRDIVDIQDKIQMMKDKGQEKHDIMKQEEILEETIQMIPESQSRLETAVLELSTILDHFVSGDIPPGAEQDIEKSQQILNEGMELLDSWSGS
ncbi:putative tubulin-specific chaperone A [Blattamonas nauphoetae]|uniref:Tubulin-specific chaperone A n=1 Tax=Blattamonas nauphoetae TaxID=2049346 RepID=A0ABQ9Y9S9_9EUKA|nr:putative tubulin-specific chaperone A [Blattamonas nauphoetae]